MDDKSERDAVAEAEQLYKQLGLATQADRNRFIAMSETPSASDEPEPQYEVQLSGQSDN